ncbi:hypothetical protein DNTS_008783 [Danionella cerebrum]|uniref:Uncharacterized protein n=1 Tax=Danionella cerebrum TaxID=2873325 RepID=A0A553MTH8_9TELE|nr:hypothetical protein DNTS_008783 [Danionella translucida]
MGSSAFHGRAHRKAVTNTLTITTLSTANRLKSPLFLTLSLLFLLLLFLINPVPSGELEMDRQEGFFLYFAYGSNLLKERLQLKNPSATIYCVARLKDTPNTVNTVEDLIDCVMGILFFLVITSFMKFLSALESSRAEQSMVRPALRGMADTKAADTKRQGGSPRCDKWMTDYTLVFGNYKGLASQRWQGGVATIEPSPGDEVWGVVWRMNMSDLESLDRQENVKMGIYSPMEVSVSTSDQGDLNCRTYIMNSCIYAPPSPQYLKVTEYETL